jgi:XisI protein
MARGAEIGSSVPFEQLSADEQAIWRVFQPVKDWHSPERYEFVFDTANHQYQVLRSGWQGLKRLNAILIHIVIRGEFVWVEEDNTELEVAARLKRRHSQRPDCAGGSSADTHARGFRIRAVREVVVVSQI